FSPLVGFVCAALLLLAMKALIRSRALYTEPVGNAPPPLWIRGLLILTCTGVSFAHGGNDGQKGMGLIMLILIGVAPTAYALNRTMQDSATPAFLQVTQEANGVFAKHAAGSPAPASVDEARKTVGAALPTRKVDAPAVYAALTVLATDIGERVKSYG